MAIEKVDVIILAGAAAGAEMSPEDAGLSRAMVKLGEKTMLQWIVDALRGSESIGRIAAVGQVAADGLDIVLEPGENLVSNMKSGIEALGASGHVLIVSSDIPLLTAKAIDDFVERGLRSDADLSYPIVPKSHCEARYPGLKRTYLKTADGVFTGGNIMLVRPDFVMRNWEIILNAYSARKHVFQLARMIGIGVLVRVLVGIVVPKVLRLSLLERAASTMLDARVAAIVSAYPEIGEDVDKPSDLAMVRKILAPSEM